MWLYVGADITERVPKSNPDNRFKPMEIDVITPLEKGEKISKASMLLKGKILFDNNVEKVLDRPMTITDILYLACVDVCEKRHVMVSRYPVGTDKGIYFNKIRVQSTVNHIRLIFNGKEYPFYPDIDLSIPHDKVGVQFINTSLATFFEFVPVIFNADILRFIISSASKLASSLHIPRNLISRMC